MSSKNTTACQVLTQRGYPRRKSRRGITLTEVLISMGILAFGLLGVAAMFPVGSYYMRKGEVEDTASAIAQSAFHDMLARGAFDPENWVISEGAQNQAEYSSRRLSYSLPFRPAFRKTARQMQKLDANAKVGVNVSDAILMTQMRDLMVNFGSGFVIDPLGVATAALPQLQTDPNVPTISSFPVGMTNVASWTDRGNMSDIDPSWWPYFRTSTVLRGLSPLKRLTLRGVDPNGVFPIYPMDENQANNLFGHDDDLVAAADDETPEYTNTSWEQLGQGTRDDLTDNVPISRQFKGDYSWIATLMPRSLEAYFALGDPTNPYEYDVSVVVLYKRVVGDVDILKTSERATYAQVLSTSDFGGQVRLRRFPTQTLEPEESPFESLKAGQFIMIFGPDPNSNSRNPRINANWYKVVSISNEVDDASATNAGEGIDQVDVTLRGPRWPWSQVRKTTTGVEDSLRAVILPGAVAVHNKTIKLQRNAVWAVD